MPKEAADLIRKTLIVDPSKRLSANEFVEHEWFVKLGLAKPKALPMNISPSNFNFKTIPEVLNDGSPYNLDSPQKEFKFQRSQSGDNPLMRKLTPNHSRSVSRDINLKKDNNMEYHLGGHTFSQAIMNNYMSAHQAHQPVLQQGNHHILGHQPSHKEQPVIVQPPLAPTNHFLQTPPTWQPAKPTPLDYRISNNYTHNQDSKINISTEILSNDQSRIKPGVLKLRSDSPGNDRSQISATAARNDISNQMVESSN